MPMKPKRPCSRAGCPNLTYGRFCPAHQKEMDALYNKYQRDPQSKRRYGSAWVRIRKIKMAHDPLCEQCARDNIITAAEEVHHIVPLKQGGTHDMRNLMSLCKQCHSRITAKEGGRWG